MQTKMALAKAQKLAKSGKKGDKKKSGFARDLADINHKAIRQKRFIKNSERSENTKGRGARKGNQKSGKANQKVPKQKGGKVNKRKGKR